MRPANLLIALILSLFTFSDLPALALRGEVPPPEAPPPSANWQYGEYITGSRVYPFEKSVSLLKNPQPDAAALRRLTLADGPLTILKKAGVWTSPGGYCDNFYRVRTTDGSLGYVWGGALAKAVVEDDLDGDGIRESVRVGIRARKPDGNGPENRVAEARVVRKGQLVSSVPFETIELQEGETFCYSLRAKAIGSQGLPGARLIRVSFEYGACDYPNGDVVLVWGGGKLRQGFRAIGSGNEFGSTSYSYVFPADRTGRANEIAVVEVTTEHDEMGKRLRQSVRRRIYHWDGVALKERRGAQ